MGWTVVTGGAGFIGLNLVERLLSDGMNVVLLDAKPLPDRAASEFKHLPGHLEVRLCDITDAKLLKHSVREPTDRILHAAAITPGPPREAAEADRIVAVNIGGTVNIARMAAELSVPRVGFVSTAAVYGAPSPAAPDTLLENTPPDPTTLYGVTKHSAELIMRRLAELYGFSLVICRLGWIFGPWEHASGVRDTLSPIFQLTSAAMNGKSVNIPQDDRRGWTYSRDVAAVIALLLRAERTRYEQYNVTSATRLDLGKWGRQLEAELPGAVCRPGDASADVTIHLYAEPNTPLLASDRLAAEFDVHWLDEDQAFREYCDWLKADPWPVNCSPRGNRL
jgi:UDP-glucose 4-epimerase